jgi:hypothetical protein
MTLRGTRHTRLGTCIEVFRHAVDFEYRFLKIPEDVSSGTLLHPFFKRDFNEYPAI